MRELPPRWPFDPAKLPFFYGWVIFIFSTLGFLFSIPGQTMGMAVFTDPLIEALELTRTELSLAYLAGTVGSSFFLTQAGRWYDRFGGRIMIAGSSFALGLMVLFISFTGELTQWLGGGAFMLILMGYFGVRFFGQGVLTSCSRNVLLHWFVKRRGLVSGIRGIFVSFGFSVAPLLIAWLIVFAGWRGALVWMALTVGLVFSVLALAFVRNSPESVGLRADGASPLGEQPDRIDFTAKTVEEARRDPVFWIYSASLGIHAMFGTALTFHVVSVFAEAGRGRDEAFGYFFPAAVFSTVTNLMASYLVDRYPLKPFLIVMLTCFLAGAFGILNLSSNWGFWLLAAGFGAGGGLWGVISNLAFIRFYGALHLGAVSGMNTSLTVFASAVGPAAFSLGLDYSGGYDLPVKCCIVLLVVLLFAAMWVRQRELITLGVNKSQGTSD